MTRTHSKQQRQRSWTDYEARKRTWERQNPNATPAEFTKAMRRLVKECGV